MISGKELRAESVEIEDFDPSGIPGWGFQGNEALKPCGVQINFTKEQVEEYIKCSKDPLYFILKYGRIISLDEGIIPFDLYGFQQDLISTFQNNKFVIGRVARQSGKTVACVSYCLWKILFNPSYTVGIFANKGETAIEILDKLKLSYSLLPYWLQQGIVEWNKKTIKLENGSKIKASTTAGDSGRSWSYNLILLDEFAFIASHVAEEFFKSVYPTISSGKNTQVIIISTPCGLNHFYKMWMEAEDPESKSSYVTFFADWRAVPWRNDAWRDETIGNVGSKDFAQEFECDFLGSANTLLSTSKIKNMVAKKPIIRHDNGFDIIEPPKLDHMYVLTVDVSRGLGKDYSAFVIIDVTEFPYKQVAKFRNNEISSILYPSVIVSAAIQYNNANVLVEINDIGEQVASIIYNEHEYEYLLSVVHKGRSGQKISSGFGKNSQYGVKVSQRIKSIGTSNLKTYIESDKLIIQDIDIISEFSTFVQKKQSYEAEEGSHDDLIACLTIFSWLVVDPYFKDLTNMDVRRKIQEEKEQDVLEGMLPPPVMNNGSNNNIFVDDEGTNWHVI